MADPARRTSPSLYDSDFQLWAEEQSRLLKSRNAAALDWDRLGEEIEDLGKCERRELRSRLAVLLTHLLTLRHQSEARSMSWMARIAEQRQRIGDILDDSPSLVGYPEAVLAKEYRLAVLKAASETGLPPNAFPEICPFTVRDILDSGFLPGGPQDF